MISSAKVNSIPVGLKVPELDSADGASSTTSGSATPELKMVSLLTPPSLKMRRGHFSSQQADKIPTLGDISSISRRLFPMKSSQSEANGDDDDDDDDDAISMDDVLADALLASPLHRRPAPADEQQHKLTEGPPFPRPPSFYKIGTAASCQKTVTHHVTPPTSSSSLVSLSSTNKAHHHATPRAAPSSSCSISFIGGTAKSAFAANNYHSATPTKGKV